MNWQQRLFENVIDHHRHHHHYSLVTQFLAKNVRPSTGIEETRWFIAFDVDNNQCERQKMQLLLFRHRSRRAADVRNNSYVKQYLTDRQYYGTRSCVTNDVGNNFIKVVSNWFSKYAASERRRQGGNRSDLKKKTNNNPYNNYRIRLR